jgi:hypothetical protein
VGPTWNRGSYTSVHLIPSPLPKSNGYGKKKNHPTGRRTPVPAAASLRLPAPNASTCELGAATACLCLQSAPPCSGAPAGPAPSSATAVAAPAAPRHASAALLRVLCLCPPHPPASLHLPAPAASTRTWRRHHPPPALWLRPPPSSRHRPALARL